MARETIQQETTSTRWETIHGQLQETVPHVFAVLVNESDFVSLLIKAKSDGTCLAVLKEYGVDGGPMVCFGSGYGALGCLLALDGAVQGGHWKADKPWKPSEK